MKTLQTIGVIGATGDLGTQMTAQVCSVYEQVYVYDIATVIRTTTTSGINPNLKIKQDTDVRQFATSVDQVLRKCTITHWCAPLGALEFIDDLPEQSVLVLHNSVMNTSVVAAKRLRLNKNIKGEVAIVHCLMNEEKRVVVASGQRATDVMFKHMLKLGLQPLLMTVQEHDVVMAHSQAPLALLSLKLSHLLNHYAAEGLLTTSAQDLKRALDSRAAEWTDETLHTILSNPELPRLLSSMKELLHA